MLPVDTPKALVHRVEALVLEDIPFSAWISLSLEERGRGIQFVYLHAICPALGKVDVTSSSKS